MDNLDDISRLKQQLKELQSAFTEQASEVNALKSRLRELEAMQIKRDPGDQNGRAPGASSRNMNLENFIGLRLMHLVGIVVLVIGISIGVKYAVDRELISEVARIGLAYAAGLALLIISFRLRGRYPLFSAILFSGSMASLYFTTYAALVYYQLFPYLVAFLLMMVITVWTAIAAIRYDRQEIAILGMTGAYGIPFLISANNGNVLIFFSYILIINIGIAFLSYRKNWKGMVLFAMLITWLLFLGWAAFRFEEEHTFLAAGFMALFYLLFLFSSVGFPLLKQQVLKPIEVQHFIYNNIIIMAAALIIFSVRQFDDRCIPVVGAGFVFYSLQALAIRKFLPREELLYKYVLAMCVTSLVCYIGMRWDGLMVTMGWIAIATALFVGGVLTKMSWMRLLSILLSGITLLKLILVDRSQFNTLQKIISYVSIGAFLLIISFFYQKFKHRFSADGEMQDQRRL